MTQTGDRNDSGRKILPEDLQKIAEILKAISHPVRLEIIELLEAREPRSVAELLEQVGIEQSLLSHHLTKMKDKGILRSFRQGRMVYYELISRHITQIFNCMEDCDLI